MLGVDEVLGSLEGILCSFSLGWFLVLIRMVVSSFLVLLSFCFLMFIMRMFVEDLLG